jgi:hypothetical protein
MMMMAIGDADNQKGVSIRKWTKGDDGMESCNATTVSEV